MQFIYILMRTIHSSEKCKIQNNMKKLFFLSSVIMLIAVSSCNLHKPHPEPVAGQSATDSLERIIELKDNEINDLMGTLNEIQEGFRVISEAENRVTIIKDGEGTNKKEQIRENIQFISTAMQRNRELISKLRQQLRESTVNGEQFKKTIDTMVKQLADKDQQLTQLRAELDAKDIHITELDETINTLNTQISSLNDENEEKQNTISQQDKQLHTAWYVFGTKKELREQRILEGSDVLRSDFNKSYFTKIDTRVDKEIKLYSKDARVLTTHPSESYTLQKDANKQYVLRITNPDIFWSTSKYLVIQVK